MGELERYAERFRRLNVNRGGGRPSPHKPCMLLAIIDLIDDNGAPENRFYYAPPLLERYHRFFDAVKGPSDHPNPHFPFFHLKGDGFWHLHALPGRREALNALTSARAPRQVRENIACASLGTALFELLTEPNARQALSEVIVSHWFDREADELRSMVSAGQEINRYAQNLRKLRSPGEVRELPEYVRDPAFRRVVLEAYDYRCAATGTRIILPDESVMVQAAQIEPFAVEGNDDPRNGLALTPDMHWAMDKNVIAPTADYTWKISREIAARLPGHLSLTKLEEKELILPKDKRFWPKREYLEWRLGKLR